MAWFGRDTLLPAAIAAAAIATLLSLHYSVYSAAGHEPVQRMAKIFAGTPERRALRHLSRVRPQSRVLHRREADDLVDERKPRVSVRPERVLCVMPDEPRPLERDHGMRVRRLGLESLYFNPSGFRLGTLLDPPSPSTISKRSG